jgi:outer membrane translocation and assembly module TamA
VVPFFDIGGATTSNIGSLLGEELYSDVGTGLRIGIPRLTGGGVIRLDAAYPLRDGPDGSMRYQLRFIITGAQAFSSYHSGENESGFPLPVLP